MFDSFNISFFLYIQTSIITNKQISFISKIKYQVKGVAPSVGRSMLKGGRNTTGR